MKKGQILLIDDSANLTILYDQELEDAGYNVDIANSYVEAVQLIGKKSYDLIIIETELRNMKGCRALQAKLKENREIPFIINTSSSCNENESSFWSGNADTCLMKSSDIEVLKENVNYLLSDA